MCDMEYCPHCGKYLKVVNWIDQSSIYGQVSNTTYTFDELNIEEPKPTKTDKELRKVNNAYFKRR